jgi:hypothetical protein
MDSINQEILSVETRVKKKIIALSIVLIPLALLILTLGVIGCVLSGTFNSSCISTVPVIYAILVATSFYIAFQITHYIVEFLEYRRSNQHLPLKKTVKTSVKHTKRASFSRTFEELLELLVGKIESQGNSAEEGDNPPVKVIDNTAQE